MEVLEWTTEVIINIKYSILKTFLLIFHQRNKKFRKLYENRELYLTLHINS